MEPSNIENVLFGSMTENKKATWSTSSGTDDEVGDIAKLKQNFKNIDR